MFKFNLIILQTIKTIVDWTTINDLQGFILSSRKETTNKMEFSSKIK